MPEVLERKHVDDILARIHQAGVPLRRTAIIEHVRGAEDERSVALSFSSETPVDRWWGKEILDHTPASVDLGRLAGGAHPLLLNHDTDRQIGVVERAEIAEDRKGRAVVRFSRSELAEEILQDVRDGIRRLVSVGYAIHDLVLESREDDVDTYRITRWEPYEISIVSIPADTQVGVGRARVPEQPPQSAPKETTMTTVVIDPPIDTAKIRDDARREEMTRVREITAIGDQFQLSDAARQAIAEGHSVDKFRDTVLAELQKRGENTPAPAPTIGMSGREVDRFRFTRYIAALAFPADRAVQEAAAFELEACAAATKHKLTSARSHRAGEEAHHRHERYDGASVIPHDVLMAPLAGISNNVRNMQQRIAQLFQERDLTVGTATAGGHTVATDLLSGSFIDALVNAMVIMQLGPTVLRDLNGNLAIPRQTTVSAGGWVAENAAGSESNQAFDQVTMTPKTVTTFTDFSRRLLLQSSLDVEAFVRMDLARALALAIDLAAINGSGSSNQPLGLLNASIGAVAGGTNGAAPTWDHAVLLEEAVANANAAMGNLAYLTNSKVRSKWKRTQTFSSTSGRHVWADVTAEYPAAVSNQVPSNLTKGTASGICSAILFGNWSDLLLGFWGGLELMLDPYTGSTAGTKRVIAIQDADIAIRNLVSFASMEDALTT